MYIIEEKKLMSLMSGLCVTCVVGGYFRHPGELRFQFPSQSATNRLLLQMR